jgi:hypothetical protein
MVNVEFVAVGAYRFVLCCVALCSFLVDIMVDQVKCVISKNQQCLMQMPFVPRSSFGHASLGKKW